MNMSNQQKVTAIHHIIVDSTMAIVASLFLIEQINKNDSQVFVHEGIKIDINKDLIVLGLDINLKQCLIEDFGEKEGLNRTYGMLKDMYTESDDKPISLTPFGQELLSSLFIDLAEDIKAESNGTIH
ncbi:hypothetical protein [Gilliamella apicola]|uniref:Uncharacterized protein n=1 Tax=Gilliamella apicola TaxID=1196095 RepID=A0A242NKT6_9GAMM|nr:hypothetical protein [Gilliamella apicola]OTP81179.1 hypothetical protein B5S40_12750 [Gilliamella apicola]OTP83547.1 hypothetical protein B5S44_12100 [Gilliamella apicola]OTQ01212.1 hypothetical protein B6D08_02120 [Gilliamella apicola]OTQ10032.1 hypothetical protein B6C91_06955 [Gilliamella apicola]OTQ17040.1 hypothetical protein B6D11_02895 [Gilliamella apicola]